MDIVQRPKQSLEQRVTEACFLRGSCMTQIPSSVRETCVLLPGKATPRDRMMLGGMLANPRQPPLHRKPRLVMIISFPSLLLRLCLSQVPTLQVHDYALPQEFLL